MYGVECGAVSSTLLEISRAFSSIITTCSMDGLCFFSPVHVKASSNMSSKASTEYSPLSLGSANSDIFRPFMRNLA